MKGDKKPVCFSCRARPVAIKSRQLCLACYRKLWNTASAGSADISLVSTQDVSVDNAALSSVKERHRKILDLAINGSVVADIAADLELSESNVRYVLKRYGVSPPKGKRRTRAQGHRELDETVSALVTEGKTAVAIASHLNIAKAKVYESLKRLEARSASRKVRHDKIVELAANGLSVNDIMAELGKSERHVRYVLAQRGIRPVRQTMSKVDHERVQQIVALVGQGISLARIGQDLNISRQRVSQILMANATPAKGLKPIRSRAKLSREAKLELTKLKLEGRLRANLNTMEAGLCWVWTGYASSTNKHYPEYKLPKMTAPDPLDSGRSKTTLAYRVAYMLYKGEIPDGMVVDRICYNPLCCNPDHLQLISRVTLGKRKNPEKLKRMRRDRRRQTETT